jgi:hypothetical protein
MEAAAAARFRAQRSQVMQELSAIEAKRVRASATVRTVDFCMWEKVRSEDHFFK